MLKTLATVFGVIMLVVGVLGFVPGATNEQGMLLGYFHVNTAHNIVHLITGAAGLWVGLMNAQYSRLFFQILGVAYGAVALFGFFTEGALLGVIANNAADNWLHAAIAVAALAIGFVMKDETDATMVPHT